MPENGDFILKCQFNSKKCNKMLKSEGCCKRSMTVSRSNNPPNSFFTINIHLFLLS